MRQCRHARKGRVTNAPNGLDVDKPKIHGATSVCDRPNCIAAAIKRIAAETNSTATYVPDPPKTAKTSEAALYPVVVQPWITRDSWSGPEDAGYSVHLTEADRKAYVEAIYAPRKSHTGSAPECYDSAEKSPFAILVFENFYNTVRGSGLGMRVSELPMHINRKKDK